MTGTPNAWAELQAAANAQNVEGCLNRAGGPMTHDDALELVAAGVEAKVCRGFDPPEAGWAARALRETIIPPVLPGDDVEPATVRTAEAALTAQLDAADTDERYWNLVVALLESLDERITPADWDEDPSPHGVLAVRLSRST